MYAFARSRETARRARPDRSRDRVGRGRRPAGRVRLARAVAVLLLLPLLAGCMYPQEMRKENQVTARESILLVQNAVDLFKEQNGGVLPIKNSDVNTPIYEKYILDLKRLTQGPYLGQVPAIAFEKGGTFLFALVNPEQKPEVKLLDLTAYQKTGDIQNAVDDFLKKGGAVPKGEPAGRGVYWLDFAKLGRKTEQVRSVYSGQYLSYLVNDSGTVGIDYATEIMAAMERKGMKTADADIDLRAVLVEDAPYVPAKSFPYHWIDNEPKPTVS